MSQQTRKTSLPRIKQYFCRKPKHVFLAVSHEPESANASSSDSKGSFDFAVQEE